MSNVIYLPGCKPKPEQRVLVEKATTVLMKEVMDVFVEHRVEPGRMAIWHDAIQIYLWASPLNCDDNGNLIRRDLLEWRCYWRDRALNRVGVLYPIY